jgi:hypothetical protein
MDPVLDTPRSSRLDIPIGTQTHSSELLETVEEGDVRDAGDRCDDLYFGASGPAPRTSCAHQSLLNEVEAEAIATLIVSEWLADVLSEGIPPGRDHQQSLF